MGLRNTLNRNPTLTTIGALVLVGLCLFASSWLTFTGGITPPESHYFYDLNTGEIFVDKLQRGPITTSSGQTDEGGAAGVKAFIFTCGSCGASYAGMTADEVSATGATFAYLQRPEGRTTEFHGKEPIEVSYVVTAPDNINWVSAGSRAGRKIKNRGLDCGEGVTPELCFPG